jgi:hypothetical protein
MKTVGGIGNKVLPQLGRGEGIHPKDRKSITPKGLTSAKFCVLICCQVLCPNWPDQLTYRKKAITDPKRCLWLSSSELATPTA